MNEEKYDSEDLLVLASATKEPKSRLSLLIWVLLVLLTLVAVCYFTYLKLQTAPINFPTNTNLTVAEGTAVRQITEQLKDANVVRSQWLFYYILVTDYDSTSLKAGTYSFAKPLAMHEVASALLAGTINRDVIKFTHVEGERVSLLAKRAGDLSPKFDAEEFLALALPQEGKLFPDTYFLYKDFTATDLYELLLNNFNQKITPLQTAIDSHFLTLDEIIILASILEREANSTTSQRMVSGILQNRLKINMALQADATMEYILDRPLSQLTPSDLREIDSPYNTYLYPGLPPTPIGNPGLEAIMAVLQPTPSNYLFYITGNDGNFYYAKDFDEHRLNIARYLR